MLNCNTAAASQKQKKPLFSASMIPHTLDSMLPSQMQSPARFVNSGAYGGRIIPAPAASSNATDRIIPHFSAMSIGKS